MLASFHLRFLTLSGEYIATDMSASIRNSKESLFTYSSEVPVNHRVSLYVAGVCACLLILITIVLVAIPQDLYCTNTSTDQPQDPPLRSPHALQPFDLDIGVCKFESGDRCKVVCENIGSFGSGVQPGEFIKRQLADFYANHSSNGCVPGWILIISKTYFPDFKISSDWFQVEDEENLPEIYSLEIQTCPGLKEIEAGALASFPFGSSLKELTLSRNAAFRRYTAGSTQSLNSLKALNLRQNAIIESVEDGFFEPFKASIEILQIQGGFETPKLMAQMIGICQDYLNRLVLVDLRFNNEGLGMRHLGAHQLAALRNVESLYLGTSGIGIIDSDTFNGIAGNFTLLYLEDNQLETLQNGTFDALLAIGREVDLYLTGNNWICDCHLKWLQDLLLRPDSLLRLKDSSSTFCKEPESQRGKTLISADMTASCPIANPPEPLEIDCPTFTTTSSNPATTITITTPTPTTEVPEFDCKAWYQNYHPAEGNVPKEGKVHFRVEEKVTDGKGPAEVLVHTGVDQESGYTLAWHKQDETDLTCVKNVPNVYHVSNLSRQVSYVFCLSEGMEIDSPSQCQGLTTQPTWEARAWIRNEKMPMWIGIFVVIAIVCALVGAASVIIAFWQKPTLLALNSRVVKVRTSDTEAVVMPKPPKKEPEVVDDASIRSDPSYVSVVRAGRVSLFAFRFRQWLRKVDNGEINPSAPDSNNASCSTLPDDSAGDNNCGSTNL